MVQIKNSQDLIGGGLLVAIAILLAYQSVALPIGSSQRMGPGYFPLILCAVLGVLGLLVLVRGLRVGEHVDGEFGWRGLAFVLASVMFFSLMLRSLGFIPALAGTSFLATLASRRFQLKRALLLTIALVGFSWAVFVKALGLPFILFGPLITG